MVKQNEKNMGFTYQARIQYDAFEELFENRLAGSGAKIPRGMELSFSKPESPQEKRIWNLIEKWNQKQILLTQEELFAQNKRLVEAEKKIKIKETKAALNDIRIAGNKIEKATKNLNSLNSFEMVDFGRIFPHQYAPLIIFENGERVIKPYRYHLRPAGQLPQFDREYDGTYNVRRDSLGRVFWWKNVFGKNHGVLIISKFWENVKEHNFKREKLQTGENEKNIVLEFAPQGIDEMLVPCIFDRNEEGEFPLDSFALITDEPNPEVAQAGHDRTPIIMKDEYLDRWIQTKGKAI